MEAWIWIMEKFNTYSTVELFFKTLNVYIIADYFTLNFFPKDKTKKIYQFSKNKCFNGNNPSHRHHYHYSTNQNTCSHEHRHQPPTKISHAILTYIFHKDTTITCHSPPHPSSPGRCKNSNNRGSGGHPHYTHNSQKKSLSLCDSKPSQQRMHC